MQLELSIFNDPESNGEVQCPGVFIQAELKKREWGQVALAEILGRPVAAVNEVIKGKRALTPEMAVALGRAFGQPAELWAHREAAYRLTLVKDAPDDETARKARLFEAAPIKDLQRRGWIDPDAQTADAIEAELTKFLGANPLSDTTPPAALARQTLPAAEFSNAQRAWLIQATRLARCTNARAYRKENLEAAMPRLRKMALKPENAAKVPIALAEAGVRLVVIEDLPKTKIDGAAFFLDEDAGKPVVALSLRIDRMESFWHTLGHELRHILNADPLSLDSDLVGERRERLVNEMERRADTEAAHWLIPEPDIKSFTLRAKPWFTKEAIQPFASRMGVHPSIVVGHLQHLEVIGWDRHADIRSKIREHLLSTATCDGYGKRAYYI